MIVGFESQVFIKEYSKNIKELKVQVFKKDYKLCDKLHEKWLFTNYIVKVE